MPVAFHKSSARRIVRATLAVERAGASGGLRYNGRTQDKPISSTVYIGGVAVQATGDRARYLWVYVDEVRAEWKSTTVSPMPPGVEIYDTHENAIHITRFG
jgi:hypothetical protein